MKPEMNRDLGKQPLSLIMQERQLSPNDLVSHSAEQITHKMVARAVKGRRLTSRVQHKILTALNATTKHNFTLKDIFNY